jgi:hypothetical protein
LVNMILKQINDLHLGVPVTRLTDNEVAGTNVLRWQNPNGFGSSWAVQIGVTGAEQTEVAVLAAATPAGTAGTLTTNTLYEHPVDTPVYAIKYDQVVFERSTDGTQGTASPLTDGTITYQADGTVTQFDDVSGSSSYGYRTYLRNSVLNVTSVESDWLTSTGFDFYSLASLRRRIKGKLWNADWLDDDLLDDWLNECKDMMVNKAIQVNKDYALGTTSISFGTDGFGTITIGDFSQIRKVEVTTDNSNYYLSTKMDINDFVPDQSFSSTHPYHAWRGDNIMYFRPSSASGTARITFYRLGTTMVNETDVLPLPMRPFTHIFVNYAKAQALSKDEKETEAQAEMRRVDFQMEEFVSSLDPRDKSSQTMIDIVEPTTGGDYL